MGHFENDQNSRYGSAYDGTEARAHSDNPQHNVIGRLQMDSRTANARQKKPAHAAKKKCRRKHATTSAKSVTCKSNDELGQQENTRQLPFEVQIQSCGQVIIAKTENAQMTRHQEN